MPFPSDDKILADFRKLTYVTATYCHEWNGELDDSGYGVYYPIEGYKVAAYRVIYRIMRGRIPKNYHVHHLCRNRACVNPVHLIALHRRVHELVHLTKDSAEFNRRMDELPDKLYNEAIKYFAGGLY